MFCISPTPSFYLLFPFTIISFSFYCSYLKNKISFHRSKIVTELIDHPVYQNQNYLLLNCRLHYKKLLYPRIQHIISNYKWMLTGFQSKKPFSMLFVFFSGNEIDVVDNFGNSITNVKFYSGEQIPFDVFTSGKTKFGPVN